MTKIAVLNDALRRTFTGGQVVFTSGFSALPRETQVSAITIMRFYKNFTADNDQHGEHDFGAFEFDGQKYFFKIYYFDLSMENASEDPANPDITKRVLTLMLAEEY